MTVVLLLQLCKDDWRLSCNYSNVVLFSVFIDTLYIFANRIQVPFAESGLDKMLSALEILLNRRA